MLTAVAHPDVEGIVRVYLKGAPELILPKCTGYISLDGEVANLEESKAGEWLNETIIGSYAKQGYRTMALAYKDYDHDQFTQQYEFTNGFSSEESQNELEEGMTFLIAFALKDDLRSNAKDAIKKAYKG